MTDQPFRISLVNMPFGALNMPSIALTQLQSVLRSTFNDRISVNVAYLNHEFAGYLGGVEFYNHALSDAGFMTGIGDWYFQQVAFPGVVDNSNDYFGRFYWADDVRETKQVFAATRPGLVMFLDELIDKYRLDTSDVVGFSALFVQSVAGFAMARRLKERNRNIITVIGGAACEGEMGREFSRHVMQIDYVFSGPGLVSFPEFIGHCLNGEIDRCDAISGVYSRGNVASQSVAVNEDCRQGRGDTATVVATVGDELDIDVAIELDYGRFLDSLERAFPNGEIVPILPFQTSRGCWWGERQVCSFCGLNGESRRFRAMSPARALRQFEALFKYADRCEYFLSVDTIVPTSYFSDVFPVLETPSHVMISYEVRPDLGHTDINTLSHAGIRMIQPGIESLSTSTLKLMRKGTTAFGNLRFLKDCSTSDLSLAWNLLLGTPGEGVDVYGKYLADMPLFVHLPPPRGAFPVGFVRYSRYFCEAAEHGLALQPHDFYAMTLPFDAEALARTAYHFIDRSNSERAAALDTWLDKLNRKIVFWRARWSGTDGREPARLLLSRIGNAGIIHDSRSGQVIEHEIDGATMDLLEYLANPRSVAEISMSGLARAAGTGAGDIVNDFCELGLLFEENGRYMSLVVTPQKREKKVE